MAFSLRRWHTCAFGDRGTFRHRSKNPLVGGYTLAETPPFGAALKVADEHERFWPPCSTSPLSYGSFVHCKCGRIVPSESLGVCLRRRRIIVADAAVERTIGAGETILERRDVEVLFVGKIIELRGWAGWLPGYYRRNTYSAIIFDRRKGQKMLHGKAGNLRIIRCGNVVCPILSVLEIAVHRGTFVKEYAKKYCFSGQQLLIVYVECTSRAGFLARAFLVQALVVFVVRAIGMLFVDANDRKALVF